MGALPHKAFLHERRAEIEYKIALVYAALEDLDISSKPGESYIKANEDFFQSIDSTEKTFIDFYIGMFLATLLAQKQYNFTHVIHYSKFVIDKELGKLIINKAPYKNKSGKIVRKSSPDLIATNKSLTEFGVFEAKCGDRINESTMIHAYQQAKQVKSINGQVPSKNIVSFAKIGSKNKLKIRTKDPSDGNNELRLNYDALIWQYVPVVELYDEIQKEGIPEQTYPLLHSLMPNGFEINHTLHEFVKSFKGFQDDNEKLTLAIKENNNEFPELQFEL